MSNANSNTAPEVAPEPEQRLGYVAPPTATPLPGNMHFLVKDIPKDLLDNKWLSAVNGVLNVQLGGYVFPNSQVKAVEQHVPGVLGTSAIFDQVRMVQIVFSTNIPKKARKDQQKAQRDKLEALGINWNESSKRFEGSIETYEKIKTQLQNF